MALPTELLDHILSFLQSDKAALRACAESHPLLSQLTEPYLYAHISLWTCLQHPNSNHFGTSKLARLLSDSPRVVHYIRKLDISIYGKYLSTVDHRLKEISAFLPRLLELTSISLSSTYSWERLPAYFCQAFWTALRSPSVQHVSISRVINFPLLNVLTREECKITQLTIHDRFYYNWSQSIRTTTKWSSPLESLCLKNCDRWFLNNVTTWLDKSGMQFRSLECSSAWNDSNTFPKLLTSSSNSLTSLDLDIELRKTPFYDFRSLAPHVIDSPLNLIPVTLSALPYLVHFTIHAKLVYVSKAPALALGGWGFYSPIPLITQLFSRDASSYTSSLRHLTLDLDCKINDQTHLPHPSSLSEVFLSPLVLLMSSIDRCVTSLSTPIQVDLCLSGSSSLDVSLSGPSSRLLPMPLHTLLSLLSDCAELMHFVERDMLFIKPLYSNTSCPF